MCEAGESYNRWPGYENKIIVSEPCVPRSG
jgi:hypothetical protein